MHLILLIILLLVVAKLLGCDINWCWIIAAHLLTSDTIIPVGSVFRSLYGDFWGGSSLDREADLR